MREGHTSNKRFRTRMEVENRRRRRCRHRRRVIRDRLSLPTIGASRKGCSTRRIGHTQCNLTSCKKVPAYFFPQKAFPRPTLEVIDGLRSSTDLSLPADSERLPPCVVITRDLASCGYCIIWARAFRGRKETSSPARTWIVFVQTFHCLLDLIRN